MNTIIVGEKLLAGAVGSQILCTDLGIAWQAAGLTLVLRVKLGGTATRDLSLNAVPNEPQQAFYSTTTASFPLAGNYYAQIIGFNGFTEEKFSNVFQIEIKQNL
ncbi:MAG: hypothetical protein ACRCZG_01380 [Culicoidibacterales bacterium]